MIVVQIICNFIMFVSFIANVAYLVWEFVRFPKVFRQKDQMYQMLPQEEYKKRRLNTFHYYFLRVVGINLLFFFVGVATCLLDGLTKIDDDRLLTVVMGVMTIAGVVCSIFCWGYLASMKRYFKIDHRLKGVNLRSMQADHKMHMLCAWIIGGFFAPNLGFTVYTILMLAGW